MAATIVFSVFCLASIVFLISFFVALWNDRRGSRWGLKVHREEHLEAPSRIAIEIDGITARSKVLSAPFRARAR